jgi:signal transduction histidine kinase
MVDSAHDHARLEEPVHGPHLVLRFALYSGLVLLAAGLAIFWAVNHEVAHRAERTLQTQAQTITKDSLSRHLHASDFEGPVAPARRAELDMLFRQDILIPGVVGARLVNRDGTITYSALHRLIGTRVHYAPELDAVLQGDFRRHVTHTVSWQGQQNVKVVQSLLPVRTAASSTPVGALEFDQDYHSVTVSVGDARLQLALLLGLALLTLYVALFPILRRVTRQLEARNARLREHAEERGRLLQAERAARTESEAVQRLLSEQNDRLRELDRLKDEFVSLVSHELRTPLTSIRGYIELLLEDLEPSETGRRRYLEVVERNSQRLLELVSDLLFLAQVEAGKLAIEREPVDLGEVVEECVEASAPVADSKGIALAAHVGRVPKLDGDRARLAQMLDNLVSNALKFTPKGGRVDVRLDVEGETALLEIEDTGVGIPLEQQGRLFERFFRSSTATENAIPGTGLGLTITKAIVERHGGRIEIESRENHGTVVRVGLPLPAERGATRAGSGSRSHASSR